MNDDTLLYRQINPDWLQRGTVTSQAFKPMPKDHDHLSVDDGSMISAADAWRRFTKRFKSVGVLAVTVKECDGENLQVRSDPQEFPEHAVIDFSGLSNSKINRKAGNLRDAACARRWCFRPASIPET